MLTVRAPAKINLTLEVLGERADGFHDIRSVIQAINLCDSLGFSLSDKIEVSSDTPDFIAEKSLVARAAARLQQVKGCAQGARIEVEKRIPLSSGLGGDSSDAAAVLLGLNELWQPGLKPAKLLELAMRLGSDVAFFLYGGTALAEGRGEKIAPLPALPHRWVVLLTPAMPEVEKKTKQLYERLKPKHYSDGKITDSMVVGLTRGAVSPSMLFNTFENVAYDFFPKLKLYKEHFLKLGAPHVHLAGSGPTLFSMIEDKAQAEDLYQRCKDQGLEAYLADTLSSLDRL
ncbi:MAG: 4-(cytidine 5'-diphospho)-2-C-methyl-D-erythritol kinase [Chloroflexi bacterium]|nr:4-(cytidine 5'-diphospho)-2-C-methyl-D-erythritol kinase [Chloroflexota bacterium]